MRDRDLGRGDVRPSILEKGENIVCIIKDPKSGVYQLPPVDRIQGLELSLRADPKESSLSLHYIGQNNAEFGLEMPLLDAIFLLNLLQKMVEKEGFEHLCQPKPESV